MPAPKLVALAIATILVPASVFASTECTKMPAEKWLPQSEVKTQVEKAGFTVQRIKQENSCYEVKGQSSVSEPWLCARITRHGFIDFVSYRKPRPKAPLVWVNT